jgi:hypothetical protein
MGGFFLICTGPNEDRSDEISRLQKAFADLGFPLPEIVKEEGYLFAAYPKFQRRSAALERDPNGDFSFVCGTCLCEGGGLADVTALCQDITPNSSMSKRIMGHYAAVLKKKAGPRSSWTGLGVTTSFTTPRRASSARPSLQFVVSFPH